MKITPLGLIGLVVIALGFAQPAFAASGPASPADRATATVAAAASNAAPAAPVELPTEWIDPDTGHRVVRLSREDNTQSLYFNQNPFTPDGTRLIATVPDGIETINIKTGEIKKVTLGRAPT